MFDSVNRRVESSLSGYSTPNVVWISKRALWGAAIVGFLVNLNALMIPIFRFVGGGLVAGFVAGYASKRPWSGLIQGGIAAAIAGLITGTTIVLNAMVLGIFIEPPSLLLHFLGPFNPSFTGIYLFQVALVYVATVVAVTVDGVIAGAVGGTVKGVLELVFGDS